MSTGPWKERDSPPEHPSPAPTRDALLNFAAQLHERGADLQLAARHIAALADWQIGPLELSRKGEKKSDTPKRAA